MIFDFTGWIVSPPHQCRCSMLPVRCMGCWWWWRWQWFIVCYHHKFIAWVVIVLDKVVYKGVGFLRWTRENKGLDLTRTWLCAWDIGMVVICRLYCMCLLSLKTTCTKVIKRQRKRKPSINQATKCAHMSGWLCTLKRERRDAHCRRGEECIMGLGGTGIPGYTVFLIVGSLANLESCRASGTKGYSAAEFSGPTTMEALVSVSLLWSALCISKESADPVLCFPCLARLTILKTSVPRAKS